MTLHTRMALYGRVDPLELAKFVNAECLKVDFTPHDKPDQIFDREHFDATMGQEKNHDGSPCGKRRWIPNPNGDREAGNGFGNGFDAAFWIDYNPTRPLRLQNVYRDHRAYNDEFPNFNNDEDEYEADEPRHVEDRISNPAMIMEVNFDTAYGYRNDQDGYGCATLHQIYITRVGAWLDERGIDWSWYDEFSGEWHHRYESLDQLTKGGQQATHWFETIVKPGIAGMVTQSGGTVEF